MVKVSAGIIRGGGLNHRPFAYDLISNGHFVHEVSDSAIDFTRDVNVFMTNHQFDREFIDMWINGEEALVIATMMSVSIVDSI